MRFVKPDGEGEGFFGIANGFHPLDGFACHDLSGVAFGFSNGFAIADEVVGIFVAGNGVVLRIHPVVEAVVTGLREPGDIKLGLGEEVPFSNVAGFVADALEEFGIGDFAGAQMGFVSSGEVTVDPVAIGGAAGEDGGAGRGADAAGGIALG